MVTYAGPTNAERFCDDTAAVRSLNAHDLPIPPQLLRRSIIRAFEVVRVERDPDGVPNEIVFLDSSCAMKNSRDRWTAVGNA